MKHRTTKSVYFSLLEPEDVKLLNHAMQTNPITNKSRNFSKYVRKLIEDDMNGKPAPVLMARPQTVPNETKNAMNSFL